MAPLEKKLGENLTEFLRYYAMKDGENIYQRGIYVATKARLKSMDTAEDVETETFRLPGVALAAIAIVAVAEVELFTVRLLTEMPEPLNDSVMPWTNPVPVNVAVTEAP